MTVTRTLLYETSPFISGASSLGVCLPREDDMQAMTYEHMAVHCDCAAETANADSSLHGIYLQHLAEAKALQAAFKFQVGRHDGFLLLYQLICEEDLAKHPPKWNELRNMMNMMASKIREKMSPYPGLSIVH